MPQNYKQMTEAQFEALMNRVQHDDGMGEEFLYACTANPYDHLHTRRLGAVSGGDEARVGIMTHSEGGVSTLFLSASDARSLAETLMTLAEEVDGQTVTYDVPDDVSALLTEPEQDEEDPS